MPIFSVDGTNEQIDPNANKLVDNLNFNFMEQVDGFRQPKDENSYFNFRSNKPVFDTVECFQKFVAEGDQSLQQLRDFVAQNLDNIHAGFTSGEIRLNANKTTQMKIV